METETQEAKDKYIHIRLEAPHQDVYGCTAAKSARPNPGEAIHNKENDSYVFQDEAFFEAWAKRQGAGLVLPLISERYSEDDCRIAAQHLINSLYALTRKIKANPECGINVANVMIALRHAEDAQFRIQNAYLPGR